MSTSSSAMGARPSGKAPWVYAFYGVLLLIALVMAVTFQLSTSEAYFLHTPVGINFHIWEQPIALWNGLYDASTSAVVFGAFALEIIYFAALSLYETFHAGVHGANPHVAKYFKWVVWAIAVFQGFTDYTFIQVPAGIIGRIIIAGILSAVIAYAGTGGLHLLGRAKQEYGR